MDFLPTKTELDLLTFGALEVEGRLLRVGDKLRDFVDLRLIGLGLDSSTLPSSIADDAPNDSISPLVSINST